MKVFKKTMALLIAAALVLTMLPAVSADIIYEYTVDDSGGGALPTQYRDLFEYKSITSAGMSTTLNYRLYVPEDYDPSVKYPVLLFLHGYGERGSDNEVQLNIGMMTNFFTKEYYKKFPCILIAAQCPGNTEWAVQGYTGSYTISDTPGTGTYNEAIQLCKLAVDKTIADYSVDTNRLYVTGLSMGGYGTWNLLTHYPDYFAGAIPICGGGDPSKANRLVNTPIWCFHGSADPTVPCTGTGDMYNAITAAGGALIDYTVWVDVGHAWQPAYVREDVWAWLFRQNKADIDTTRLCEKIADVENADASLLSAAEKQEVKNAVAYAKNIVNGDDHSASLLNAAGTRLAAAKTLLEGNLALETDTVVIDCGRDQYSAAQSKERINDNDMSTGWQLGGDGKDYASGVWVGYDFGREVTFGNVGILWEDGTRSNEGQYTVQISSDGQNWTDLAGATYTIGTSNGGATKDTVSFSAVTARYVRVNMTGGSYDKYYPKIYELSVSRAAGSVVTQEIVDEMVGIATYADMLHGGFTKSLIVEDTANAFTDWETIDWENPYTDVPAAAVEEYINDRFIVPEGWWEYIRSDLGYIPETGIYHIRAGGGYGGFMPEREYIGGVQNDDGSVSLYFAVIDYDFLDDHVGWEEIEQYYDEETYTYLYEGTVYEDGPEGPYRVLGLENSGKKHTFVYEDGKIKFRSTEDYTAENLPEVFDYPALPEVAKGDTDGDGIVGASDLTALARHVGGVASITDETLLRNADLDGDGEVGAADLTMLARFVGGIISEL